MQQKPPQNNEKQKHRSDLPLRITLQSLLLLVENIYQKKKSVFLARIIYTPKKYRLEVYDYKKSL